MNPCSDHYTPAACAAAGCEFALMAGLVRRPQPATEQQQHDEMCPATMPEHDGSFTRLTAGQPYQAHPPDRQAASLGALHAGQVATICEILADVLDSKIWLFYEQIKDGVVLWKEWQADAERLDFIAEVRRRIYAKAAPATRHPTASSDGSERGPAMTDHMCPACRGKGDLPGFDRTCRHCNGSGVWRPEPSTTPRPSTAADDPDHFNPAKGGNDVSDNW